MEGYLTFGGEHTMKYIHGVLLNCILEAYIILLSNVTPIDLIKKKICSPFWESSPNVHRICFSSDDLLRYQTSAYYRIYFSSSKEYWLSISDFSFYQHNNFNLWTNMRIYEMKGLKSLKFELWLRI